MARIRSIKPEFWTDGTIVQMSAMARLFYIGTWNFSLCDKGHLPDDPMGLKLRILPADNVDPHALIAELIAAGRLVRRRTAEGRSYLFNPRLTDHQKVDARWQSRCPYCAVEANGEFADVKSSPSEPHPNSPEPAETPRTSAQDRKGWDGIGKEVPPTADATPRVPTEPDEPTSQTIVGEWIERCPKRPPRQVIGQIAKQVKALLAEGIEPDDIRRGLAEWMARDVHPSVLPSIVNNVMNRQARASPGADLATVTPIRPSTSDLRVAQGLAIADKFDQLEQERSS